MSTLRVKEISALIKEQIKKYSEQLETAEVGTVVSVGDGIAIIHGLSNAMYGELLEFPGGIYGMVLNLEASSVGAILLIIPQVLKKVTLSRVQNVF